MVTRANIRGMKPGRDHVFAFKIKKFKRFRLFAGGEREPGDAGRLSFSQRAG